MRVASIVRLLVVVFAAVCSGAMPAVATERLNVLVLVADDMAHDDMSCAGHPQLKTPHIDRIAAGGVRFTHAFTPNPICTPSRAALLTGQDCFTNDCYYFGRPIRSESRQFAPLFVQAGYETFFSGKWHNDGTPAERGFQSGVMVRGGGHFDPRVSEIDGRMTRTGQGFSSTIISDAAVRFLAERSADERRPFLMYVSYTAPHDPWTPPGKYDGLIPAASVALPPNFKPEPGYRWYTAWHGVTLRDEALMPFPRTPAGVRDVRSRYSGMVMQLDEQIGRVLDQLEQQRLADNTLVLFVADHGISLGAHGFSGKQTMYEEGIRLPLIVWHPRLERAAAVDDRLVSLIDIFPTLCEAAGIAVPAEVEGVSLLGAYQGNDDSRRERIFAAFQSPDHHRMISRMVRTERHKLIHNIPTDEVELYDLADDPYEMRDLADDRQHAALRRELMHDLLVWRRRQEPADLPLEIGPPRE